MTNLVATNHGWKDKKQLKPSDHLYLEVSSYQLKLLHPTAQNCQIGSIVDQAFGQVSLSSSLGVFLLFLTLCFFIIRGQKQRKQKDMSIPFVAT